MEEDMKTSQINLCWYVGAAWTNANMTDKFVAEGYWENEWDDKFTNLVNQIQVGDKIAIKSSYTQKNNLPFDINNGTASVMSIKYIGTVTKNYNNGKRVDVEWDKDYVQKSWYFFTIRTTIWKVERKPSDWMYGALLDFTFNNAEQKYDEFLAHPYWANKYKLAKNTADIKYLELVDEYKNFFKKNKKVAFDNEVYKWELLTQNKGKNGIDLISAVRTSKNLIFNTDKSTLKTLVEKVPNELEQIIEHLLDESNDLLTRLAEFKNDMKSLVKNNLNSTNYEEDELTAALYLTYSYPEKYTFYTNAIYKSFCEYLELKTKESGEIYPHYCELLHKLKDFVSKDDELLEMIANSSSNYVQSDLLLAQNIVYVMLKEKFLFQNKGASDMSEPNDKAKELADLLLNTHNLILHGAPGTGKTYLARQIADAMGCKENEIGFVQFHPSYDYTDFVEGLRPKNDSNGQIGFERKDGVFKTFCERALKNSRSNSVDNFDEVWEKLVGELSEKDFVEIELLSGKDTILIELNEYGDGLANRTYENDEYEKGKWIRGQSKFFSKEQCYNIYRGLPGIPSGGHDNYRKAVVKYMKDKMGLLDYKEGSSDSANSKNPFVFIIDEINRGDMSKIFGELFFAIEPSYRGAEKCKDLRTQYANLQETPNLFDITLGKKEYFGHFFIPENVYIIGTMNDIDRSVESMDFAFRRRFTFKEITAEDSQAMLDKAESWGNDKDGNSLMPPADEIKTIKDKMNALNNKIWHPAKENEKDEEKSIEGLSSAYHIGGAYFLKLKELNGDFDLLWEYHLAPLLHEYLRGMENEDEKFEALESAYNLTQSTGEEG